uniref:Uncharacterized protein n=1 Tax=Picea glauca TaxID=3330 RepID=A0A101M3C2_PICGL|nr:hypothetical protein ABT39_MTgene3367 [Picea glauca]QHR89130.1 hypothetical protein Q903MT_gene3149 [Picea sitchensis]
MGMSCPPGAELSRETRIFIPNPILRSPRRLGPRRRSAIYLVPLFKNVKIMLFDSPVQRPT